MPIYEYRCESCGHELDALQKLSDAPLVDCPDCDSPSLRRLISAASFRLKGGGWYETDFKSEKETKRNLVESAKDDKAEKKPKDGDKAAAEKKGAASKKVNLGSESKKSAEKSDAGGKGSGSAAA